MFLFYNGNLYIDEWSLNLTPQQNSMYKKLLLILILAIAVIPCLLAQKAVLPFELYDSRIHISLQVNDGEQKDFMFDTGAESAVFDSEEAKKANIKIKGSIPISGASGREKLAFSGKQKITLKDDLKINGINLVLTDLSGWREKTGRHFDGIIGYDILGKYVTQIDYDNRQISLFKKITDVDVSDHQVVDFDFKRGIAIPQFEVAITLKNGDTFKGLILFDTGAGLALSLNKPFIDENELYSKIGKTISTTGGGLNKKQTFNKALIASMNIGGFDLGEMTVQMSESEEGVTSYSGYLGLLGNEVISRFNVVLDYKNKKLYLKPNLRHHEDFSMPLSGIKLVKKEDKILIEELVPGCHAFQVGLRVGDHIHSVKGDSSNDLDAYRSLLESEPGGISVVVKESKDNFVAYRIILERLI